MKFTTLLPLLASVAYAQETSQAAADTSETISPTVTDISTSVPTLAPTTNTTVFGGNSTLPTGTVKTKTATATPIKPSSSGSLQIALSGFILVVSLALM